VRYIEQLHGINARDDVEWETGRPRELLGRLRSLDAHGVRPPEVTVNRGAYITLYLHDHTWVSSQASHDAQETRVTCLTASTSRDSVTDSVDYPLHSTDPERAQVMPAL
jgi:hypothetical protein